MGMKLPKDLERKILSMCGEESKADAPTIATVPKMVQPSVAFVGDKLVAYIPCVTRTEANESSWARKMLRKLPAKRITRETLGPYAGLLVPFIEAWHRGEALRVTFTRLGSRRLDAGNLPSSLKSVEDVVAAGLFADDGDPKWMARYEQSPGGEVGVRVEISVA